ncbi:GntR family transcriptional regulator [Bordetella sp. BOR01]|uniref:GntR family transcriptional regulator n=1 Tax=Bordetella sp. BOR01 TaxID=2854779 RepID=UPI001C474F5F|nr:GntR family transcriptional regulator [Bordetella sp. BOR01]MBV7486698.1 GntR family transcriptional regulator [Bordetella sp. BOR01]
MATQIIKVVDELREAIISGALQPGERIIELQFSAKLGVSRTPLRLALAELEREGLLERRSSRGFRVRAFSANEIADAIEVRGALEGMAARLVAERGLDSESDALMKASVEKGWALMKHPSGKIDAFAWRTVNAEFHAVLVAACGNRALEAAIAANNNVAFSGPGALALQHYPDDSDLALLRRAQEDHEAVYLALKMRQGGRAEGLMKEHAWRSSANRRMKMAAIRAAGAGAATPATTRESADESQACPRECMQDPS